MRKTTVVFDLDGTLLDTLEDLADSTNYALARYGFPTRTLEEVRCFVGNGVRKLIERALPGGAGNARFEEVLDCFKRYYVGHCKVKTGLYPGIPDLLLQLKAGGYKVGIVSNKLQGGVDELYHYYFDEDSDSVICSSQIGSGNDKEKNADQFASYFLVPSAALYAAITKCKKNSTDKLSLNDIIRLEQYFGISHQAMLIRLQSEGQLTSADLASMQGGIISAAARLGFDTSLYKPTEENKKMQVLGHYICQAENLLDNDVISQGKYEELLLDAFREDIVYGLESEEGDIVD